MLTGSPAALALSAAKDVGRSLSRPFAYEEGDGLASGEGVPVAPPGLAGGIAGVGLALSCLAEIGPGGRLRSMSGRLLRESSRAISSLDAGASLYGGSTGAGWAVAHARRRAGEPPLDDALAGLDRTLAGLVRLGPWEDDYDLVNGLVGYGVYALERLPDPRSRATLRAILSRLEESAEHADGGLTWKTAPELLPPNRRRECPNGHYNLGLAHGVPGVVAFLGRLCEERVAVRRARELLEGAVPWLLRQRTRGARVLFGYWVGPGVVTREGRQAWCYGDPGVAAALLLAARGAREPAWEKEAVEIALHAASCPPDGAGVVDAGLCHGAAGLGHVFNRIYQATGIRELGDAARFWFERTLEMRREGAGIAGFTSVLKDEAGEREWADPGLLTGAAGVALSLVSAALPVVPAWDRILLLSGAGSR